MVRALSFWMNPFRPKTWDRILLSRIQELNREELTCRLSIAHLEGQIEGIRRQRKIYLAAQAGDEFSR